MGKIIKAGIVAMVCLLVLQVGALPMSFSEAVVLQVEVLRAPYSVWDYEIHEFDCSNMAALLCDDLQSKGYNASIASGSHPNREYGHAWVRVDGKPIDAKIKLVLLGAKPIFDYRYPVQDQGIYNSADEKKKSIRNETLAEKEYGYEQYLSQRARS